MQHLLLEHVWTHYWEIEKETKEKKTPISGIQVRGLLIKRHSYTLQMCNNCCLTKTKLLVWPCVRWRGCCYSAWNNSPWLASALNVDLWPSGLKEKSVCVCGCALVLFRSVWVSVFCPHDCEGVCVCMGGCESVRKWEKKKFQSIFSGQQSSPLFSKEKTK